MSDLAEIELRMKEFLSQAELPWAVPLLDALEKLGGEGKPKLVEQTIKHERQKDLTEDSWDSVFRSNRIRWVRLGLNKAGLMDGEYGVWRITEDGRRYLDAHRTDFLLLTVPKERQSDPALSLEFVEVTDFDAYHYPVLSAIANSFEERRQVMAHLRKELSKELLEGDFRRMPQGEIVWEFRAHWAFSALLSEGLLTNPSRGIWVITDAGRKRVQDENWSIKNFQRGSKAKVVCVGGFEQPEQDTSLDDETAGIYDWALPWQALSERITQQVWSDINDAVRPDLDTTLEKPFGRNVILYGPPGTGKTWVAQEVAKALTGDDSLDERLVQFHPSYSYEDFVQGIKPDLKDTQLKFDLVPGPFLSVCKYAADRQDRFVVLVIDEINRGDPARIFGELLYALEYRDKKISLPSGALFMVPSNLIVIGTMNSVDRSVALVDYALRRRFCFVRLDPVPEMIPRLRGEQPMSQVAESVLGVFNKWLVASLGDDYTLGHSFFLNEALELKDAEVFSKVWKLNVKPLMEEYFFGKREGVEEARKVWDRAVKDAIKAAEAGED